jgi:hypothetical protein
MSAKGVPSGSGLQSGVCNGRAKDRGYRLEWAEKIGMGFDLPARSSGLRSNPFSSTRF